MIVSRETQERLDEYAALLSHWNSRINLVAPGTIANLRRRHIEDCLQICQHVTPADGIWADLGSGGGLPGLVLAIAFQRTETEFRLVESDQRKAVFLRTAIRQLDLANASVVTRRIEDITPLNAAYVSARALAPLPLLMPYLSRHMADNGQAWLMKGERWQSEVRDAQSEWRFACSAYPSLTHSGAAILKISEVSHV
jgi:16S rRNA (guanine527-N7)-methyltransferase